MLRYGPPAEERPRRVKYIFMGVAFYERECVFKFFLLLREVIYCGERVAFRFGARIAILLTFMMATCDATCFFMVGKYLLDECDELRSLLNGKCPRRSH